MSTIIYNSIKEYKTEIIEPIILEPSDDDYKKGFIYRYFAQQHNNLQSKIIEIEESKFIFAESIHRMTKIRWRLRGPVEEVRKSNNKAIKMGIKVIPRLRTILPNLTEFHFKEETEEDKILERLKSLISSGEKTGGKKKKKKKGKKGKKKGGPGKY
jgi:hypothetical protein